MNEKKYFTKTYVIRICDNYIEFENKENHTKIEFDFDEAVSLYVILRDIFDKISKSGEKNDGK